MVIDKRDLFDSQAFFFVQVLLVLENSLVEKLLKLLVAIIDAKLLKAVDRKVFEAGNIQNADIISGFLDNNVIID